jgi:hypothetical protein
MAVRTGYLVGGILCILILGLGGGVIGAAGLAAPCSNNPTTQQELNVQSCNTALGVAAFGFILLVVGLTVGIVLLVKSYKREAPPPPTVVSVPGPVGSGGPYASLARVCLNCGTVLPSPDVKFCPRCGKPVPM